MKNLSVLVVFLCFYLTSEHAFSHDAGPTFFNATDDVMSLEITYGKGSGFHGDFGASALMEWPFPWQVQTIKVRLKDGSRLAVSQAQAVRLRGKLAKPSSQVWVIDGSRICVVASRKFKATRGFRCPIG